MELWGTSANDNLVGGEGNDSLVGLAGDDSLAGGAGDDAIRGDAGNDLLNGGAGNDLVSYYWAAGPVAVDLASGLATGEGNDTLLGIEHVLGSAHGDSLAGDAADNDLWGDPGNDQLSGAGGSDYLVGSAGNDTLDGGEGFDYAGFSDNAVAVTVDLTAGRATDSGGAIDTLVDIEGVYGSWFGDALAGDSAANLLLGAPGNDSLDGAGGIDNAMYVGTRSQYTVAAAGATYQVTGTATGEDTDTLTNIERLLFSDFNLALDLGGNAGTVAKVLGAVLGQGASGVGNKAYAGIGLEHADAGMSYGSLMQLALQARLGANPTNEAVVSLLYTNVIGSAPDASTQAHYVSFITSGNYTQASLGVMAADYMGIPALALGGLEFVV